MKLSKEYTSDSYNRLDLSNPTCSDWSIAFDILENRLNERYLEPADKLIEFEASLPAMQKKYGFTILAIDCLLIETIQSFYDGVKDSSSKSRKIFKKFLMERDKFKNYFTTDLEADNFYVNFRCGILHQAQTLNNTKVHSVGPLLVKKNGFTIVNRIAFHDALKDEVQEIIDKLRKKNDPLLLSNFKTKMDFIANN